MTQKIMLLVECYEQLTCYLPDGADQNMLEYQWSGYQ